MNHNQGWNNHLVSGKIGRLAVLKRGDGAGVGQDTETVIQDSEHKACSSWFVVAVFDGDTFDVKNRYGLGMRVRVWGIDAPEHGQLACRGSRRELMRLLRLDPLVLQEVGADKYGRMVCKVTVGAGLRVDVEMVRAGWAWWYKTYCPKEWELRRLQKEARALGLGLWAEGHPVPPWIFRHSQHRV